MAGGHIDAGLWTAQPQMGRNLWSFAMKTPILAAAVMAFTRTCALAEEGKKPSKGEAKNIKTALSLVGCDAVNT